MHDEARSWVARHAHHARRAVVEIGGRDINGGVRDLFDVESYVSIDDVDGPGVDVVCDAAVWRPSKRVDTVVCCEVLEHAVDPAAVVAGAAGMLRRRGVLLLTCATDPRAPHSGLDGGPLHDGEHYANVDPADLEGWLDDAGFDVDELVVLPRGDLQLKATRR